MSDDAAEIAALVAAAQAGCVPAREALVCRYRPLILKLSRRRADLDDVEQRAVGHLLELIDAYRPDRGVYFGRYLVVHLRWRLANDARARRRRTYRDEPLDASTLPVVDVPDRVGWLDVRAAVARLPARQREVIVRAYWLDQRDAEIAREWQVSREAVGQMRHRAESALRRLLSELSEQPD